MSSRLFPLALVLTAGLASAQVADQAPASVLEGTTTRLWLTGGGAMRSYDQLPNNPVPSQPTVRLNNVSPLDLHLSGALWGFRNFGLGVESRVELMWGKGDGVTIPYHSFDAQVLGLARLLAGSAFAFEFQLGWGLLGRSALLIDATGPVGAMRVFTGPALGIGAQLWATRGFTMQFYLRASPALPLGDGSGQLNPVFGSAIGLQTAFGAWRLGSQQLSLAATLEVQGGLGGRKASATPPPNDETYVQFSGRLGLGFLLATWVETATRVKLPPPPAELRGRVTMPDGSPAVGVEVTLDGQTQQRTGAEGRFVFATVPSGPHHLEARREKLTPAVLDVETPLTGDGAQLVLGPPTGPGTVRGVVKQDEHPVQGVVVSCGELQAKTGADGVYELPNVGPGQVHVKTAHPDFKDADEVAQVAPGGTLELDLQLVPRNVAVKATLRGLIRSKGGETLAATVRVVELKLKLQAKADGRFSAEVPKGRYTVVIEAKGYLSQTKTVEVSEGDQAIFHAELERAR
ncbi:MAG: carboxypeptidase regulatory-like domain-containing protein [Myxococcaceae bacterium]